MMVKCSMLLTVKATNRTDMSNVRIWALVMILGIVAISCKKDDEDIAPDTTTNYSTDTTSNNTDTTVIDTSNTNVVVNASLPRLSVYNPQLFSEGREESYHNFLTDDDGDNVILLEIQNDPNYSTGDYIDMTITSEDNLKFEFTNARPHSWYGIANLIWKVTDGKDTTDLVVPFKVGYNQSINLYTKLLLLFGRTSTQGSFASELIISVDGNVSSDFSPSFWSVPNGTTVDMNGRIYGTWELKNTGNNALVVTSTQYGGISSEFVQIVSRNTGEYYFRKTSDEGLHNMYFYYFTDSTGYY